MLNELLKQSDFTYKLESGDNFRVKEILNSQDFELISEYVEGIDIIAIDEAQQIKNIGKGLKIIIDQHPEIKIIATGSSSFDLSQKIGEPLTGRKKTIKLFPFSQGELLNHYNTFELKSKLNEFLIYGSYPEVVLAKNKTEKKELLEELVDSYLFKDILALENLRNPSVLKNLLKMLSFQVGNLVSINELSTQLRVDNKTILRYLDLLEKTFVIFKLNAFSSNPRKEISKKSKYYFLDNGIRNGIISQYAPLDLRNDIGQLWENFVISELYKVNSYKRRFWKLFFWRNYHGQEIDLVIEDEGKINCIEVKWTKSKYKIPNDFLNKYGEVDLETINNKNYIKFLTLD